MGNNFAPVPDVNFARLTAHNSMQWHVSSPYPKLSTGNEGIVGESCTAETGYMFCLGGYDDNTISCLMHSMPRFLGRA